MQDSTQPVSREAPGYPEEAIPGAAPLRVLIIDDNPDLADTEQALLERFGYIVAVARTGRAGLETARRFRPDVVLCDLVMPGLSGYEVAATLRQEPTFATTRLLAVTAYDTEEDRRRARCAGFEAHLVKPVPLAELQAQLRPPADRESRRPSSAEEQR